MKIQFSDFLNKKEKMKFIFDILLNKKKQK